MLYGEGLKMLYDAMRLQLDMALGSACFYSAPFSRAWSGYSDEGIGRNVLLIPGFMGPEASLHELKVRLGRHGYVAKTWGRGINFGHRSSQEALRIFAWIRDEVSRMSDRSGSSVSIIGQSLGGIYAREAAKICPEVERVITLGTPAYLTPGTIGDVNTLVSALFQRISKRKPVDQLTDPEVGDITAEPPCHLFSIWSKNDGVVRPRAARIPKERLSEIGLIRRNVEVVASHMGMGAHPRCVSATRECLTDSWIRE